MRCICILVFDLKNAFPYCVLLIYVFLDAYSYIERAEDVAGSRTAIVSDPDRKYFPVKTGGLENHFLALWSGAAGTGLSFLVRAG